MRLTSVRVPRGVAASALTAPFALLSSLVVAPPRTGVPAARASAAPAQLARARDRIISRVLGGDPIFRLCVLAAVVASIVSLAFSYSLGLTTAFYDAKGRLIMARMVFDSVNPGPVQLGFVWPPVPQALMLPFVWNDFLYHSGLAGSFVSMACYVVAVVFLYRLIVLVTDNRRAAAVGVVAFSTPNVLFMATVPMSEMPFIAFLTISAFYLTRWTRDTSDLKSLLLAAAATALAMMTRYESWLMPGIITAVVAAAGWWQGLAYHQVKSRLFLALVLPVIACLAWLGWNWVIVGDPLFFTRSEFSAAQIAERTMEGTDAHQRTAGNIELTLKVWGSTMIDNIGVITSLLAGLGVLALLASRKRMAERLAVLGLLFPAVFYVVTMYAGHSTIIRHPDYFVLDGVNTGWGVRYGTLMAPAAGFFAGFLVHSLRAWLTVPVLALAVLSSVLIVQAGPITLVEARAQGEAERDHTASWLDDNYDRGQILILKAIGNHLVFQSGLPLSKLIFEGAMPEVWEEAREDPVGSSIDWIVMFNHPLDPVWRDLRGKPVLTENYSLVFSNGTDLEIYKIKDGKDQHHERAK